MKLNGGNKDSVKETIMCVFFIAEVLQFRMHFHIYKLIDLKEASVRCLEQIISYPYYK